MKANIEEFANELLQMELRGLQVMLMYLLGLFQLSCVLLIFTSPAAGTHVGTDEGQSTLFLTKNAEMITQNYEIKFLDKGRESESKGDEKTESEIGKG